MLLKEGIYSYEYIDIWERFDEQSLESGPVGQGVVIKAERFLVQAPLGTWPGLATQPRYEAPGDLWVEYVNTQVIDIG